MALLTPGDPGTHDAAPVETATSARQGTRNPTVLIVLGVSLLLCVLAAVFLYGFAPDGPSPADRKGAIEGGTRLAAIPAPGRTA